MEKKKEDLKAGLEKNQFKPFPVNEFDNDKQLMIMQIYDMANIQEFLEAIVEVQASKCNLL